MNYQMLSQALGGQLGGGAMPGAQVRQKRAPCHPPASFKLLERTTHRPFEASSARTAAVARPQQIAELLPQDALSQVYRGY